MQSNKELQESIRTWLLQNTALSIRGIEKEAALPQKTLNHFLKQRRNLNSQHIEKLYPVLKKYGFSYK